MDIANVMSFILGALAGLVLFALFLPSVRRRAQVRLDEELARQEHVIADLRQERASDRETNRRLRHELAIKTPVNYEATREERDSAIVELAKLNSELSAASMQLADRDRSLREARLAIHDIRVQLERDRLIASGAEGQPSTITGEVDIAPVTPGLGDDSVDESRDRPEGETSETEATSDDVEDESSAVFVRQHPLDDATTP